MGISSRQAAYLRLANSPVRLWDNPSGDQTALFDPVTGPICSRGDRRLREHCRSSERAGGRSAAFRTGLDKPAA